jgi:Skp family chaperone for outer membrane proteins
MKNCLIITFFLVVGITAIKAQDTRIAIVNEQEVLKEYKYAKEVQAQMEAIVKGWQDTIILLRDSARKMQEAYNAAFDSTPFEERKVKIAVIRELEDYIDAYGYERGNAYDGGLFVKTKDKLYAPVIEKFKQIVAQVAKKEKVDIVYAEANLMVTGEVTDLTQKVIEALK